jgi:hypothetical protein
MPEVDLVSAAASAAPSSQRAPHFVFHGSQHWTVEQIREAFTELHYMKVHNFVPGKGKKVASRATTLTLLNAVSLGGVAAFYEAAAQKISTTAVSFLEAKPLPKTIAADTLKKIFEKRLAYRITQRLSWGKGPNAFHRTGDGDDFPNPDMNDPSLMHFPESERFPVAYCCAQIDDLLDSHLQGLAEMEIKHRQQAAAVAQSNQAPIEQSGGSLQAMESNSLQMIVRQPNQHAFGQPMLPSAPEGSVSAAACQNRGQHIGGATKRRSNADTTGTVHKVLDFGTSVTNLGASMMERMKRPSLEEEVEKYEKVSKCVVTCVSTAVVDAVKEWKKPAEIQAPKSSALLRMNAQTLFLAIKDSGQFFGNYPQLSIQILSAGLDGATIARMSDEDVKQFLTSDCQLSQVHATILIAKLACWRDTP